MCFIIRTAFLGFTMTLLCKLSLKESVALHRFLVKVERTTCKDLMKDLYVFIKTVIND